MTLADGIIIGVFAVGLLAYFLVRKNKKRRGAPSGGCCGGCTGCHGCASRSETNL